MTALLGIDLGTGSAKALVVDEVGRTLGSGYAQYPLRHPHPGWAEQEPDEWWRAAIAAVRMALIKAGNPAVAAIGLSGQMHGTVLLDAAGQEVRPAIIWADTRSGAEAAELTAKIGRERLIEIAGSPLAAGFQAASIAWVQHHEPDVWSQTRTVLLPKDYLRWRLTGHFITEPSDASGTLLLDVHALDWSDAILAALGIGRDQLPLVMASTHVGGRLTKEAASIFALEEGTPVVGGGGDAPLAELAAGVVRDDQMALTISSGSQVILPTNEVRLDPQGRIHSWSSALAGVDGAAGWYQMGATMVSGLAMRWLSEKVFDLRHRKPDKTLTKWAAEAPPGAGGLLFLPYLAGERTPHMNPTARGAFLGLTTEHGRGHLVRAVMEGATLALFDAYDVLRSLGATPLTVVLCGGGAQSTLWRQIVADVFGMPVSPLLTVEQSALGAALLAGAAIGLFDPAEAAKRWATYDDPVEPDLQAHGVYAELLPIFRDAYSKHVDDFDKLATIGGVASAPR
jgi:xylulokinase